MKDTKWRAGVRALPTRRFWKAGNHVTNGSRGRPQGLYPVSPVFGRAHLLLDLECFGHYVSRIYWRVSLYSFMPFEDALAPSPSRGYSQDNSPARVRNSQESTAAVSSEKGICLFTLEVGVIFLY